MCKSVGGSLLRGWWVWASGSYTQPWVSWQAVKELCSLHSQDPAGAIRNTLKSRVPQQFSLSRKEASGEARALYSASSDSLVWRHSWPVFTLPCPGKSLKMRCNLGSCSQTLESTRGSKDILFLLEASVSTTSQMILPWDCC